MLAERMRRFGIRAWIDEAEINIGDSLIEKIGQAIDESDFVGRGTFKQLGQFRVGTTRTTISPTKGA